MEDQRTPADVARLISKTVDQLKQSHLHTQLQKAAEVEVGRAAIRVSDVKTEVVKGLINSGWERKLRNMVYQHMQKESPTKHHLAPAEHNKEPLTYLRKAQVNWEKRILKSLNSMCTELGVPLARRRPEKEQREVLVKWSELGTDEPDLSAFRPVYAPKDFLDVLVSLKNPNMNTADDANVFAMWGIMQVPLQVKNLQQLRLEYSDLTINQCQTGVEDSAEINMDQFQQDRIKLAKKVLASDHCPLAQEFAKKGIPQGYRAELWQLILGLHFSDEDALYYEHLKAYVLEHDLLVDSLIYKDVKLTATNDDQYFVFEDVLYQVLLPFSRDTSILRCFEQSSATPAKSYIRGRLGDNDFAVMYPPSGVIPFHGFTMYVATLCYLYNDPVSIYFVFRELYTRYFFRLHAISSHPEGIVSLCVLFEKTLQAVEPQLFFHLKQIGCQPLRIAFRWLIRAFAGYLASDQVLSLWDKVLAYDSVEIIAILAAAIFSYRKTNLLQVKNLQAAEAVMVDVTTISVVPLLQMFLFTK
ncbi:unnamed protein product [Owenia fusiformis]|uniref:Rab-GAP TBC domain-containing protein n=1 Tax=Owenia fusiformis TaxID=6347 RepID=A0A8S4N9A0_OWEFU|nr:unnamed protein product [Owenia fusiformis]